MLTKRIIPCLDVKNGVTVKGVKFVDLQEVGDPPEMAASYERQGADEIVFLDISASAEGRKTLMDVVERTAQQLFIPLTVGGGIRSREDMRTALNAGADKIQREHRRGAETGSHLRRGAGLRTAMHGSCHRREAPGQIVEGLHPWRPEAD